MGREVGEEFRMGSTCTSMADSCQCIAKSLQYYKVISLQLKLKKITTWNVHVARNIFKGKNISTDNFKNSGGNFSFLMIL